MTFASSSKTSLAGPALVTLKRNSSAADIATTKSQIEAIGVSFTYVGNPFDYTVTLTGSNDKVVVALKMLQPKTEGFTRQLSELGPRPL